MTDEPMIEELERLEAAATKGPWQIDHEVEDLIIGPDGWLLSGSGGMGDAENAALIVATRNYLPSLLSELEAAREALGRIANVDCTLGCAELPMHYPCVTCIARAALASPDKETT